jgi:Recombination endonuclease VII/HNH endonuclease
MEKLTIERLKELFSYDPETGVFTCIARGRGRRHGTRAGSVGDNGYRTIIIDGVQHFSQRLAWFWVNGTWPRLIRFQNGDKDDCRIDNLREGFYLDTKHDHGTKEGRSAYQREYRSGRREEFSAAERERKFGVTRKQYGDMLLAQDGCCAICRQPETATRNSVVKALAVDHCHDTGVVRGLLCVQCNTGIGKFKDNRNLLLSAIKYLDKHAGRESATPTLTVVPTEGLS